MKLKYAMFEQKKNKLMTVLIFFQIVIVFIMLVSIISAITSRYEKYKPLECFFQGDGLNMHIIMAQLSRQKSEIFIMN